MSLKWSFLRRKKKYETYKQAKVFFAKKSKFQIETNKKQVACLGYQVTNDNDNH